jgi:chorismate mutase
MMEQLLRIDDDLLVMLGHRQHWVKGVVEKKNQGSI